MCPGIALYTFGNFFFFNRTTPSKIVEFAANSIGEATAIAHRKLRSEQERFGGAIQHMATNPNPQYIAWRDNITVEEAQELLDRLAQF